MSYTQKNFNFLKEAMNLFTPLQTKLKNIDTDENMYNQFLALYRCQLEELGILSLDQSLQKLTGQELFEWTYLKKTPSEVVLENIRLGRYKAEPVKAFRCMLTFKELGDFQKYKEAWTADLQRLHEESQKHVIVDRVDSDDVFRLPFSFYAPSHSAGSSEGRPSGSSCEPAEYGRACK